MNVYGGIIKGDFEEIKSDFVSLKSLYDATALKELNDSEFLDYIGSDEYKKLYYTDIDENGIKSAEPRILSPSLRAVLNEDFEIQIGEFIYKIISNEIYKVPELVFNEATFRQKAIEVLPLKVKVNLNGNSRVVIRDCTKFFLSKRSKWHRKMQGKMDQFTVFATGEFELIAVTKAKLRTSFGWWRATRDYDLKVEGVLRAFQSFHQVTEEFFSKECNKCADVLVNGLTGVSFDPLAGTHFTHEIDCGDDCKNESFNGSGILWCSNQIR